MNANQSNLSLTPLEILQDLKQVLSNLYTETLNDIIKSLSNYKALISQLQNYLCKNLENKIRTSKESEIEDDPIIDDSLMDTIFFICRKLCLAVPSLSEDILKACLDHLIEDTSCNEICNLLLRMYSGCEAFKQYTCSENCYKILSESFHKILKQTLGKQYKKVTSRHTQMKSMFDLTFPVKPNDGKLTIPNHRSPLPKLNARKLNIARSSNCVNQYKGQTMSTDTLLSGIKSTVPKLDLGLISEFSVIAKDNTRSSRRTNKIISNNLFQGQTDHIKIKEGLTEHAEISEIKVRSKKNSELYVKMKELANNLGESYFAADFPSLLAYKQESDVAAEIKNPSCKITSESLPLLEKRTYSAIGVVLNLIAGAIKNKPLDSSMDMKLLLDSLYLYCSSQKYYKLLKTELYKVI